MLKSLFENRRGQGKGEILKSLSVFRLPATHRLLRSQHRLPSSLPCSRPHVAWEPHEELSFQYPAGGGVLGLLLTQRVIPQIFVGFSAAGNTQASEESASCAKQSAMFKTACCLGTAW